MPAVTVLPLSITPTQNRGHGYPLASQQNPRAWKERAGARPAGKALADRRSIFSPGMSGMAIKQEKQASGGIRNNTDSLHQDLTKQSLKAGMRPLGRRGWMWILKPNTDA